LRALKTIELLDSDWEGEAQPQCVSCSKLNLRRRIFVHKKTPAVAATTLRAAICCQSMLLTYPNAAAAQLDVFPMAFPAFLGGIFIPNPNLNHNPNPNPVLAILRSFSEEG
jgi:hypothetical protein